MNHYTPLLSNAVKAASVNTQAQRDFVYKHARKTLLADLTGGDHPASPEHIEHEMRSLEDAIANIEATLSQGAAVLAGVPVAPLVEDDQPPGEQPAPAEPNDWRARIFPTLKVSGVVLRIIALLSNPYFLIGSLFLGVYIGLFSKPLTALLSPVGDLYIELLKMVLIPFMISAIVVSLSRLLGSEMMRRHIGSILTVFTAGLTIVALLGLIVAVVLTPGGDMSSASRQTLGQLINRSAYAVDLEIALNTAPGPVKDATSKTIIEQFVPDNIFHALTTGDNLKILFFALAFGIGLGSLRLNRGDGLRIALLSVYDVCTQLIVWVNMLLPVALCAMVAKQVATVGTAQLVAMIRFTIGFGIASVAVCIVSVLVLAWASRTSLWNTLKAIRQPFLLAVATRSSITCIPASMTALTERLKFDQGHVELLLPLGVTLFRFGPVLYYAFTTVFVAQLYGIEISPAGYVLAFVGSLLTGLASAGTTGVLTISLLGVIFQPLGLPLEAALALLVTIDPVIDIFRTASIVLPNCAAVAVVYRKDRQSPQPAGFGSGQADAAS